MTLKRFGEWLTIPQSELDRILNLFAMNIIGRGEVREYLGMTSDDDASSRPE
jgi:hypothetical protein